MFNKTEYEVIGSIGFAQAGTGEYFAKEKVEKEVILDIIKKNDLFKIPEELQNKARLVYKSFPHDVGCYYELCAVYDLDIEDDEDKETLLWNWINGMCEFDFESEEILEKCQEIYGKTVEMQVLPGGKGKENQDNKLKIS